MRTRKKKILGKFNNAFGPLFCGLFFFSFSCGGNGNTDKDFLDASVATDGGVEISDGGEVNDANSPSKWEEVDWNPLNASGDDEDDCGDEDPTCDADIHAMRYGVLAGSLYVDVRFYDTFPINEGSLEVFLIPTDMQIIGHTVQVLEGEIVFWNADCRSVAHGFKHDGCHWSEGTLPTSFELEWLADDRMVFVVDLQDLDFSEIEELRMGVGAAPFKIEVTSEYTDRYPDSLWVTAVDILGLETVSLNPSQ